MNEDAREANAARQRQAETWQHEQVIKRLDKIIALLEAQQPISIDTKADFLKGWAIGFRNAAYVVRQGGGSEERAKAFEDAAGICEANLAREDAR